MLRRSEDCCQSVALNRLTVCRSSSPGITRDSRAARKIFQRARAGSGTPRTVPSGYEGLLEGTCSFLRFWYHAQQRLPPSGFPQIPLFPIMHLIKSAFPCPSLPVWLSLCWLSASPARCCPRARLQLQHAAQPRACKRLRPAMCKASAQQASPGRAGCRAHQRPYRNLARQCSQQLENWDEPHSAATSSH